MKKYTLLEKTKRSGDRELFQIQALRDLVIEKKGTTAFIREGDLGGYIESEKNLSHEGKCWVYEEAEVFGDAEVSENAQVSGNAKIYESATIFGDAEVIDSGRVYGRAVIGGNAKIQDHSRVYGTAVVRGYAIVRGDSRVYDHAIVRDKAQVEDAIITGEAQMRGDAFAEGCTIAHDILALTGTYIKSPLYVCGSKESLYMSGPNLLTLGGSIYDTRSLAEWSHSIKNILKFYHYTREEINEYIEYFKMFQKFGNQAFQEK